METGTWITLALASVTIAALSLRGERRSSVFLLLAIVGLGGAWHHHRWNDLSPDDVSPGVSETPQPAWVRGVIAEFLGTRTSEGYARRRSRPDRNPDGSGDHRDLRRQPVATASGRALLIAAGDRADLHAGQPVELAGQLRAWPGRSIPASSTAALICGRRESGSAWSWMIRPD